MDLHLKSRTVLITGASKGIGRAVAEAFAGEGCDLVLVARDAEQLSVTADHLRGTYGPTVRSCSVDLRNVDEIGALVNAHPEIDILINNAGDIPSGSILDIDDEAWRDAWELKVYATIRLTREYYRRMKERGHGVILNNIGIAGERPRAGYIAGGTGCAALIALTKGLGNQSLFDGIRVLGINTGSVETERLKTFRKERARKKWGDESRYEELYDDMPLRRPAKPEEVADLIVFLSSPRAGFISGSIHTIDAGGTTTATRGL
jgi:NAD(P)-dependent dehydrogenase (short-subunit alcohol dehydrogenase family)